MASSASTRSSASTAAPVARPAAEAATPSSRTSVGNVAPAASKSGAPAFAARPRLQTADASIEALQLRRVMVGKHGCLVQGKTLRVMIEGKPGTGLPWSPFLRLQTLRHAVYLRSRVGGPEECLMALSAGFPWRLAKRLDLHARIERHPLDGYTAFLGDGKNLVVAVQRGLSMNVARMNWHKS